jgi:hypothetical protein
MKAPGWLVTAFVTAGISTSWAVGGDLLKDQLTPPKHNTPAQRYLPQQRPRASIPEQIAELRQLEEARRGREITPDEYLAEKQKVLNQPLGP